MGFKEWSDTERLLKRFPRKMADSGRVYIDDFTVSPVNSAMSMMTDGPIGYVPPGHYLRLVVDNRTMMSNTRMEYLTNLPFIEHAKGKVLIAGLGLGLVLDQLISKVWVDEIDVVEKDPDVLELVANAWKHRKVLIHEGDIFEWRPAAWKQYDTMFFDIWPDMKYPGNESSRLHNMFRKYRKPDGIYMSWGSLDRAMMKRLKG